jgi:nuclear transcription Y subunit beta
LAASEKCQQEKRKTVNGEDILFAMTSLGFENYSEALKIYLSRYREVSCPLPSSVSLLCEHIGVNVF